MHRLKTVSDFINVPIKLLVRDGILYVILQRIQYKDLIDINFTGYIDSDDYLNYMSESVKYVMTAAGYNPDYRPYLLNATKPFTGVILEGEKDIITLSKLVAPNFARLFASQDTTRGAIDMGTMKPMHADHIAKAALNGNWNDINSDAIKAINDCTIKLSSIPVPKYMVYSNYMADKIFKNITGPPSQIAVYHRWFGETHMHSRTNTYINRQSGSSLELVDYGIHLEWKCKDGYPPFAATHDHSPSNYTNVCFITSSMTEEILDKYFIHAQDIKSLLTF